MLFFFGGGGGNSAVNGLSLGSGSGSYKVSHDWLPALQDKKKQAKETMCLGQTRIATATLEDQ